MSHRASTWAFDQDLPPNDKLLLLALADEANDDGESCYPGQERLARKTSMSVRTVQRRLASLQKCGLISRRPRFRGEGRGRSSDSYRLHLDQGDNLSGRTTKATPRDDQHDKSSTTNTTPVSGDPLETREETRENPSSIKDEGFDAWWGIYPRRNGRRVGKKKARERWRKLPLDERRDAYRATLAYAAAVEDGQTIAKDPERFIDSNRVWEDWLAPAEDEYDPFQFQA